MEITSLNGEWKLTGPKTNCSITLPGDVHSTLIANNLIPDPYYEKNESDLLWIGQSQWTFERDFTFKKIKGARNILEFSQADTCFSVYINGSLAGKGENQFRRFRFDISDLLKDGNNKIKFVFDSPEKIGKEKYENLPYPVPFAEYDNCSPYRNMIRKTQCHGGWDWGPNIMPIGIYEDIFITSVADGLFNSVRVDYIQNKNEWTAHIKINYQSFNTCVKTFSLALNGSEFEPKKIDATSSLTCGDNLIEADIKITDPYIWKTSGELKQAGLKENQMYILEITENDSITGPISINKQICFSSLKVVSQKDNSMGKPGRSLYFENNGHKIFTKGENWIPVDVIPSRCTKERYEYLIKSAFDANLNCIRVWGGGMYEKDYFYQLCDKYGIIIWQDCMFACSLYPTTPDFLKEVELELQYQIPRLQSHPCIGIWCGNNENYGTINWFPEIKDNRDRYLVDYDRLNYSTVGRVVKELDPKRQFWPSSPCAGPDDFADNWHSDSMGDMHFWSVWHEKKSFDAYLSINPRFVSEFGYESFPSLKTISSFAQEKDYNFTSPVMEYHQRSGNGNSIMLEMFSRYFRFPNGFENMIYLSQVQQALAIKTAVEYWKSLMPHCLGSIIWQLNDVWPCPSWSSIEYNGRWKLLHYELQKFFDNVSVSAFNKDGKSKIIVCNETFGKLKADYQIKFLKFDGSEYKKSIQKSITLNAESVTELYSQDFDSKNKENSEYFIQITLDTKDEFNNYHCENTLFLDLYKKCNIETSLIEKSISEKNGVFYIELSTNKPAFFVSIDTGELEGRLSTNMITLIPGEPKIISFTPSKRIYLNDLLKELKIYDLSNTTN
ncbi:MAG: glycoside hydrolase family 2 protein [Treponema sp.]|nr:glycoside hydrolase family 2 protein [Treponema sp.]